MIDHLIEYRFISNTYLLQITYMDVYTKVKIGNIEPGTYIEQVVVDYEIGEISFRDLVGNLLEKVKFHVSLGDLG